MQIFKYFFFIIFFLFFAAGCKENLPVYATFCGQSIPKPHCLKYPGISEEDKVLLEKELDLKEDMACPYTLKLTKYRIGTCNNPVVKSTGSDFDGYVRMEIHKGFACHYKVQSDYKSDQEAALFRVLKRAKKDIGKVQLKEE